MYCRPQRLSLPLTLTGLLGAQTAGAAEVRLQLELPRASPPPYVAVWLEKADDQSFAGNLAVWYDTAKRGNRGTRWLTDLPQWWRKSGGVVSLSADAVTGATRAPGVHSIALGGTLAITGLAPGAYDVVIEAVREHGGYDLVRLPLTWPAAGPKQQSAQGRQELGGVRLTVAP